ncbi:MAG: ornithine cyclodeaminase family protein, partial [Chloroflexi bacterium]|nr:ornithine cyclodeaminase family protein [Chloroflexota bacterium]
PWLHINAVGSDFPGKFEIPVALLERAFVSPDFPLQALAEGECQQLSREQVGPPLFELVRHPEAHHPVREQLSVFDSTGWALEDQVSLEMMLNYARELGVGTEIEIESAFADPLNPYGFLVG